MATKTMVPICCIFMLGALLAPAAAHRMLLQTSASTNDTGDLFVLTAATATLTMTGDQGSLQMDGLRPQTVWFADKPSRRGGQLNTSDFLSKDFIQNGQWINNPNIALYSSDSKSGDTVISLAIMSNPRIINATSVVFPMVSNLASTTQKPSSVATYYQNQAPMKAAGTAQSGPKFVIANTTLTLSDVAMFVDPWYCGCGCLGYCGCGWHDTACLG